MRIKEPESPAEMRLLTADEKSLLTAQRHADAAKAALIENLINLGELDEAIGMGSEEAAQIKEAIEKDDDERCDCVYEVEQVRPGRTDGNIWVGKTQQEKKYLTARKVWSEKHGKVIKVSRCFLCGHLQATDQELDEVHAQVNEQRAQVDSASPYGYNRVIKPE